MSGPLSPFKKNHRTNLLLEGEAEAGAYRRQTDADASIFPTAAASVDGGIGLAGRARAVRHASLPHLPRRKGGIKSALLDPSFLPDNSRSAEGTLHILRQQKSNSSTILNVCFSPFRSLRLALPFNHRAVNPRGSPIYCL